MLELKEGSDNYWQKLFAENAEENVDDYKGEGETQTARKGRKFRFDLTCTTRISRSHSRGQGFPSHRDDISWKGRIANRCNGEFQRLVIGRKQ